MSLSFTFLSGTVIYLDPNGRVKATLGGSVATTVDGVDNNQELAEELIGNAPGNFKINEPNLEYLVGDNLQQFGAAGAAVDKGSSSPSASPSASVSLSPSASPSASASRSPSASPSASPSSSPSASVSRSPSASPSAS